MLIFRWLLKLMMLPVMLLVTLILWIGIFLTSFSGIILYLFSGFCFLLAAACYLMGICSGAEAVRTLMVGFAAFVLPHFAEWALTGIAAINAGLCDFLRS